MIAYKPKYCNPYNKIIDEIVKIETKKEDFEYTFETKVTKKAFFNQGTRAISTKSRNIQNTIRRESVE